MDTKPAGYGPTVRARGRVRRHVVACLAVPIALCGARAVHGQTLSDPPTQDEQLRLQLALGDAAGCVSLLRPEPGEDADDALARLGPEIGNELRAICGTSAVNSASSLGGGLNSLQATKTQSQFRLIRRRIDQRLRTQPPPKAPSRSAGMFLQTPGSPSRTYADTPFDASGLFGEFEYEWRDRVNTPYESGYESKVRGLSVGLDRMFGSAVAGGWISFTGVDADLTGSGVLIASPFAGVEDEQFRALVNDPNVLGPVCGGSPNPGALEQDTTRFGGFVGALLGGSGFVDGSVSWARRTHDYSRGVCTIENQGQAAFAADVAFVDQNSDGVADSGEIRPDIGGGVLFQDANENGTLDQRANDNPGESVFDDIFAGTLTGSTRLHEFAFSIRTGADLGSGGWNAGPRVILTYARTTTDPFVEAGRSTVANSVHPNSGPAVQRTLGGPIGMELAFDEQSRYSLLLELGGEVGRQITTPFGALVPFGSAYWRHEFNDERTIVTVRLAQDLRSSPTRFSFGTDAPDANTAMVAGGLSALFGSRFALRAEYRQLLMDDLFDSNVFAGQARLRF
jgi:Autotransporter beta-domain